MKRIVARAALAMSCFLLPAGASAADKVALLIGNSGYPGMSADGPDWSQLPNAVNDVDLVAASLKEVGFEVQVLKDEHGAAFDKRIDEYAKLAEGARISVVYYAGHGFEFERRSYLVPVNAPVVTDEQRVWRDFVDFEQIANKVARADANFILVDACRSGAPVVRVTGEGGARETNGYVEDIDFDEGRQVIILYSTARGRVALDAAPPPKEYSPFAWAVARAVRRPFDVNLLPAVIRQSVEQQTDAYSPPQQPYPYGAVPIGTYLSEASGSTPGMAAANLAPLAVTENELATIDAPLLTARVLLDRSPGEIEALAIRNDPVALFLIGHMYAAGIGVARDPKTARSWMEKPAALGTWFGKLRLADFLNHRSASKSDRNRALDLYRDAADEGVGKALGQYAFVLMEGRLVDHSRANYDQGLELMRKAADAGYPYAMYALAADGKEGGNGVYTSRLRALAASGNSAGEEWLCDLAARRADAAEALRSCRKAAEAGSAIAQARLAIAYHDGLGVAVSDSEARHWTRLALSQDWNHDQLRSTLDAYGYRFTRPAR